MDFNQRREQIEETTWKRKILVLACILLSGMTMAIIIFNDIQIMVSLLFFFQSQNITN